MGGLRTRLLAALLIAFVAMSAQCVASCSTESALAASKPPCHKSPTKAPETACSLKVVKVEPLASVAVVPMLSQPLPDEPSAAFPLQPLSPPPSHELVATTVLRI